MLLVEERIVLYKKWLRLHYKSIGFDLRDIQRNPIAPYSLQEPLDSPTEEWEPIERNSKLTKNHPLDVMLGYLSEGITTPILAYNNKKLVFCVRDFIRCES